MVLLWAMAIEIANNIYRNISSSVSNVHDVIKSDIFANRHSFGESINIAIFLYYDENTTK